MVGGRSGRPCDHGGNINDWRGGKDHAQASGTGAAVKTDSYSGGTGGMAWRAHQVPDSARYFVVGRSRSDAREAGRTAATNACVARSGPGDKPSQLPRATPGAGQPPLLQL